MFSQVDLFQKWKVELLNVTVWKSLRLFLFFFAWLRPVFNNFFKQMNHDHEWNSITHFFDSKQLVEFWSELVCEQSEPFVSLYISTCPPHPTPPSPLLICNLTKLHFSECLAHRGLQSFHSPAHTRCALRARLGTDPKAFVQGRTQRLLRPEDSAAMRTILSELTDEFSHVYDVGCTGQKKKTLEFEWCTLKLKLCFIYVFLFLTIAWTVSSDTKDCNKISHYFRNTEGLLQLNSAPWSHKLHT